MQTVSLASEYQIKNIRLWTPRGEQPNQDILVRDGRIVAIEPSSQESASSSSPETADQILLPIGVDPQVHLRVPGQPQKETPQSGLTAALAGGIGALLTMPNTSPVIDSVEVCKQTKDELASAEKETGVEVLLSAAITHGQRGKEPVEFTKLAQWGVRAFTDDGLGVVSDELMRMAFRASSETGLPILQHAEYPGHKGVLAPGPVQARLGLPPYPESAEVDMVRRDLTLLRDFSDARYHVLHVSSAQTIDLIRKAKADGLNATCEVSPHHLYFCADQFDINNAAFKMNPPLRSKQDRTALRTALAEGVIDFVATDHAPHEPEAKSSNLKTAAYGTTGLETSLRVLLALYQEGILSPARIVETFSLAPARFLGLEDSYGNLEIGQPFKAVLVSSVDKTFPITTQSLASKSKNSCFLGSTLPGYIRSVFIGQRKFQMNRPNDL